MTLNIPINNIPNQSLNVVLNQQNCSINLLTRGGNVYFDFFVNSVNIIYGRKLNLTPILPYAYMQSLFKGNLILLNNDGNIIQPPDYKLFGVSQSLIYYTSADLNNGTSS